MICGASGRLMRDHVPPKGSVPSDPILVQTLGSYISSDSADARPPHQALSSRDFPTLCSTCNNKRLGGRHDPALIALASEVTRWLRLRIDHDLFLPRDIVVSARQAAVGRAVVGHLLAADEDPQRALAEEVPLASMMRSFFLEENQSPPDELRVHIWPYPEAQQVLVRQFCIYTLGRPRYPAPVAGALLKFFPLAFLVTRTSVEVPGFRFGRLDLTSSAMSDLALPLAGAPRPGWPERIQGNEALLLANDVAYVAGKVP